MKLFPTIIVIAASLVSGFGRAATPEQEKAFVDGYRKALEAGDAKALAAFFYTKGAEPDIIEFFKGMQAVDPPHKVVSVELVKFADESDEAQINEPVNLDGKFYKFPVKPFKKLVTKVQMKDSNGKDANQLSKSCAVAEKDGKIFIPVPVPVK